MYERCSVCGLRFEREEGYWTGAIALNLSVMVVILVCAMVPLAIVFATEHQPLILFVLINLPLPVLVPILFFRHSKSLWLSIDFLINPGRPDEWI